MAQLEPIKSEIERAGAQLAYIAAEKATGVWKPEKFLVSHPISFPFLLDEDRDVTKAYGLYHRFGIDALQYRASGDPGDRPRQKGDLHLSRRQPN